MKKIFVGILLLVTIFAYSFLSKKKSSPDSPTPIPITSGATIIPTASNQTPTIASITPAVTASLYKDGNYTGDVTDAFYGNVQVQTIISHGKLTDVQFLQYPNDRGESIQINTDAMPRLKQEAIQAQNATVDIVSGATQTSQAFIQSLQSALIKAKS